MRLQNDFGSGSSSAHSGRPRTVRCTRRQLSAWCTAANWRSVPETDIPACCRLVCTLRHNGQEDDQMHDALKHRRSAGFQRDHTNEQCEREQDRILRIQA